MSVTRRASTKSEQLSSTRSALAFAAIGATTLVLGSGIAAARRRTSSAATAKASMSPASS